MRIATTTLYQSAVAEFQSSQADLVEAQRQTSSQKLADDLKGFNKDMKTLVSTRGFLARAESFSRLGVELEGRLSTQDLALQAASDSATNMRTRISNAMAADRGEDVMQAVNSAFSEVLSAMNSTYAGRYVFAGVSEDTPPVNVTSVATLPTVATMDTAFDNAQRPVQAQIAPNTFLQAAPLAEDVATEIFSVIKRIYDYDQATPLTGNLNDADRTFLEGELAALTTAFNTINQTQAVNGAAQSQLENVMLRQESEENYFNRLAGDIENADLAEVAVQLSQAQVQLEASAAAFNAVRQSSLLNFL